MSQRLLWSLVVLLVLGLLGATPASAASTHYVFTDLGVLGGLDSRGWAINDLGQVVGHADTEPGSGRIGFHGFLWTPDVPNGTTGAMTDLGALRGDTISTAYGVNDSGLVVGASISRDTGTTRGFIYDGTMHELGGTGCGINRSGQVVGESIINGIPHPFVWIPSKASAVKGRMYDLGVPAGSPGASAVAINSSGVITGGFYDPDYFGHAFVWVPSAANGTSGTMTALVEPAGVVNSFTQAINDSGLIVGTMNNGVVDRAFVYDTAMRDLGTLSGGTYSFGYGINSLGDIVGYAEVRNGDHAFIYSDGVMTDLNKLLPASARAAGVVLTAAYAINNGGQLTGVAVVDGHRHGFLLTPA
jgi:probable HAF family extracellular repeat protein